MILGAQFFTFREKCQTFAEISNPDIGTEIIDNRCMKFTHGGIPDFSVFFRQRMGKIVLHGIAGGMNLLGKITVERNIKCHGFKIKPLAGIDSESGFYKVIK